MNLIRYILLLSFTYLAASGCYSDPCPFEVSQVWQSAEYLYSWVQNSPVSVPLITANNNPGAFGIINEPGTTIIFGEGSQRNSFKLNGINGARLTLGGWINHCYRFGIEASGFGLSQSTSSFQASSINSNIPIINIPFFSTTSGENVLVNRFPNTATVSDTFHTYGFELNGLYELPNQSRPLMLLAGFRYWNINEDLILNDAFNPPVFLTATTNINDNFSTKNAFYGFQLGGRSHFEYSHFIFNVTAKVAIGDNYQKLRIKGQTNLNNTIILQPIGLFAEPSNIGTFKNNQFAILPELQAKLAYNLTAIIHPFISYNCTYLNKLIRPGNQIDRTINQSQNRLLGGSGILSGPPLPAVHFKNSDLLLQMVGLGVEFVV